MIAIAVPYERSLSVTINFGCLSPTIQSAIIDGTQPVDLTLERLARLLLPLDRPAQECLLSVTAPDHSLIG